MTTIKDFRDSRSQCWATVRLTNGEPIWISVAQTGVVVKRSRVGLFGATLYKASEVYNAAITAKALAYVFPVERTPDGITNAVLKAFTNAVLHCDTAAEVTGALNLAVKQAEKQAGKPIDEI